MTEIHSLNNGKYFLAVVTGVSKAIAFSQSADDRIQLNLHVKVSPLNSHSANIYRDQLRRSR